MKTFVTDNFRVTLKDNGGVNVLTKVLIEGSLMSGIMCITYDPESELNWSKKILDHSIRESNSIIGLGLSICDLEMLRKALEVVGKQDLFDQEITIVNKEE